MDTVQQNNLDIFIDTLIEQKHFSDSTPEVRDAIAADLKIQIDQFIILRTLAQFTQDEVAQYKELVAEQKSRAELTEFAKKHIVDYTQFLTSTLLEFQERYLTDTKE